MRLTSFYEKLQSGKQIKIAIEEISYLEDFFRVEPLRHLESMQDSINYEKAEFNGLAEAKFITFPYLYKITAFCKIQVCGLHPVKEIHQEYVILREVSEKGKYTFDREIFISLMEIDLELTQAPSIRIRDFFRKEPIPDRLFFPHKWTDITGKVKTINSCGICNNIMSRFKSVESTCLICMEEGDENPLCLHCVNGVSCGVNHHAIHKKCITLLLRSMESTCCPVCKKNIREFVILLGED